jgi:hypothetical protein
LKRHKLFSAITASILVTVLATSGCTAKSNNSVSGFELEKEIVNYSEVPSMFANEMLKALPESSEVRRYSLFIEDSANVGYLKSDAEDNVNLFYDSFAEQLKDFDTGVDLPIGVLRVRRKDAEKHIRAGETFAFSNFEGFPEQLLNKALFMLV